MAELKISFLEREFFAGDVTGTTIRGYEPAKIRTKKGVVLGRVILPEMMEKKDWIDTVLFHRNLSLSNRDIDLAEILNGYDGGMKWLECYQKLHLDYFNIKASTILSMGHLQPPIMLYTLYPEDIKKIGSLRYRCPSGVIESIPSHAIYCKMLPPMKLDNGKYIPNVYYKRQVSTSGGKFDSYSIKDPNDNKYLNVEGVLLGKLEEKNIRPNEGDFEKCFPINHFLEVSYPVSLRDVNNKNPLKIRVELTYEGDS
ncbi:hypothetical protein HYX17_02690 [Candidatus Woesearchaeota archaeon]|nr:hypothetical protein [Candidatus Woesearchaeota archaeon]